MTVIWPVYVSDQIREFKIRSVAVPVVGKLHHQIAMFGPLHEKVLNSDIEEDSNLTHLKLYTFS